MAAMPFCSQSVQLTVNMHTLVIYTPDCRHKYANIYAMSAVNANHCDIFRSTGVAQSVLFKF